MGDYVGRFENSQRELLQMLRVMKGDIAEGMPEPLQTWWLLRNSGLSAREQGNILGHAGNQFSYEKVVESLKMQYGKEALQEVDRGSRSAAFLAADEDDGEADDNELMQLMALDSDDDDEEAEEETEAGEPTLDDAVWMAKKATRTFKAAGKMMRDVRRTRKYYPTPGEEEKDPDRNPDKHIKCLGCGRYGHRVRNCTDRSKGGKQGQGQGQAEAAP